MEIAAIEEECLAAMSQAHIERRIAEGAVDQRWVEHGSHDSLHPFPATAEKARAPESSGARALGDRKRDGVTAPGPW
jgi:hypothetical protein